MTGHVTQNSRDDKGGHVLRLVTVLAPEVKYLKTNDCKTHGSFFCLLFQDGHAVVWKVTFHEYAMRSRQT